MSVPNLLTVKQFCDKHPAFKEGGLRWQIFHAEENGLEDAGAVIRIGRKVLIDEKKYFDHICQAENKPQRKYEYDKGVLR